ncbi:MULTISPECIES: hypothetical protein [unclassified Halobacteriovorax]|uniref:hypothetical protein n=1 Tax=unclassified Halobacteriovorax TaxID=2639665 RepID=UPI00399A672D
MGLFGSSKSSSSSTQENNPFAPQIYESDDAKVTSSRVDASKSTVLTSENGNILNAKESNVFVTDGGAIQGSLLLANQSLSGSLASNDQARVDALTFAGGAMQESLRQSDQARQDALMFGGEAFVEAMEATAAAQERAVAAERAAAQQTAAAYKDALGQLRSGNADAYSFAGGAVTSSLDALERSRLDSFEFVGGAFDRVLNEVRIASESASQTVAAGAAHVNNLALESLNRVESANRADSSKFMEMALWLGAGLGALFIWKRL